LHFGLDKLSPADKRFLISGDDKDYSLLRENGEPSTGTRSLLAMLNDTVLGLLMRQGVTNVAEARRKFAYQFDKALHSHAREIEVFENTTALEVDNCERPSPPQESRLPSIACCPYSS
jgi:hypothetical protein